MHTLSPEQLTIDFLAAMRATPALFDEWARTPNRDAAALGALVGRTLRLAENPDTETLREMAALMDTALRVDASRVTQADTGTPAAVGFFVAMQHDGEPTGSAIQAANTTAMPNSVGFIVLMQHE